MAHRLLSSGGMATAAVSDAAELPREPRRLHAALLRYPEIAGALATGIGGIVLIGWLAGLRALTHPRGGMPMMAPNTAVMAVCAGIALWVETRARRGPRARVVARILATVVLLFATATL